jgi:hypothetical protein
LEERKQSGAERGDLGYGSALDVQDVELERAELGVARSPETACGGRHAVGRRGDEPPVAVPVDAEGAFEEWRDGLKPFEAAPAAS